MKPIVIFEKLNPNAVLPKYAHDTDSGADLCCIYDFPVFPGALLHVHTGLRICLPPGYEAQVRSKSGLAAKHGIMVLNSPGTIDNSYTGELIVLLKNTDPSKAHEFKTGDKIAQLVICPVVQAEFEEGDVIARSGRGCNGFGSTGR